MTLDSIRLANLRPRLHRYVLKRVGDAHLADDIVQEVLMKLHIHGAQLPADDERRTVAWVLRTARNAIVDHYRRAARGLAVSIDAVGDISSMPITDLSTPVPPQLAGCTTAMVGRLPTGYREAIELADLEQLPQHEVARHLGISLSGAKSRVQRGRRQLRAIIGECCDIEMGRRGSVVSVEPTARARDYCGEADKAQDSCVQSRDASSTPVTGRGGREPAHTRRLEHVQ